MRLPLLLIHPDRWGVATEGIHTCRKHRHTRTQTHTHTQTQTTAISYEKEAWQHWAVCRKDWENKYRNSSFFSQFIRLTLESCLLCDSCPCTLHRCLLNPVETLDVTHCPDIVYFLPVLEAVYAFSRHNRWHWRPLNNSHIWSICIKLCCSIACIWAFALFSWPEKCGSKIPDIPNIHIITEPVCFWLSSISRSAHRHRRNSLTCMKQTCYS